MKNTIYGLIGAAGALGIIAVLALIIFGPFITIWGLNTLFHLGIPYTLETYFAVVAVSLFFNFRISTKD
jgi:hypothetical protein